jgi:hypothetical protein
VAQSGFRRCRVGILSAGRAILVTAALVWSAGSAAAREVRDLDADRDAFTPTTSVIDPGKTLLETAYTFIDNRIGPETHSFPELIVRWGITERFELRFGANQEIGSGGSVVTAVEVGEGLGEELSSETSLFYGCKVIVTEQAGWLPRSAAIIEAFTPVAGEVWGTEPTATYVFGWELPEAWRFDAAIRYAYSDSETGTFDKWMPSVVLRMPLTSRFEVHAEWFGNWTAGRKGLDGERDEAVRNFAGPGFHYVIGKGFEIGTRMGWGFTRDSANYFVDSGFAVLY